MKMSGKRRLCPVLMVAVWSIGCHSLSGKPAEYPPRTPVSKATEMPAWLETRQQWRVGDWVKFKDDGVLTKGSMRLTLIARDAKGNEWWEVRDVYKGKVRPVQAVILRAPAPGSTSRAPSVTAVYEGKPGEVGQYESIWRANRITRDIQDGWNLFARYRIVPRKGKYDSASFSRDDVEAAGKTFHALRLVWKKRVGPGSMEMTVWVSPLMPGRIIRVTAKGYLGPIRLMKFEREVVAFGHDARPVLRLPARAWPL